MAVTWDTPPTAEEMSASDPWSTPPTSEEMGDDPWNAPPTSEEISAVSAPAQKPEPDMSFGSAFMQGVDQPLEAMGTTAEVFGLPGVAKVLRGATTAPVGYESAGEAVSNPKEGAFKDPVFGLGLDKIPRAIVEQFGQVGGSIIARIAGGLIGKAVGGAVGTAATAPTGPGAILGGTVGSVPGTIIGQFAGPFLFGALQVAGPIAKERAKNNGRAEPNGEDISVGLITAAASGSLDAIGARYLPGGNKATGGIVKKIASAFAVEGGTEGIQDVAEQTGESIGTKAGLKVSPKRAIGAALIGGLTGGTVTAAASPVTIDKALVETESATPPAPLDPQMIGQADAAVASEEAQPLAETGSSGDAAPGDLTGTPAPVEAGTSNLSADVQKNIADAKMIDPEDPARFLQVMADTARKQGKEEAALNFEAAVQEISQPSVEPQTGVPVPTATTEATASGATDAQPVTPDVTEPSVAGLTEDFVNAERAKRGEQPVSKEKPVTNEETLAHGEAVVKEVPTRPREVMERLRSASPTERTISREDGAILLAEKRRLTTARNKAGDRSTNESLSPEERAVAKQDWDKLEAQVQEMDQAAQDARSTWGGFGQFWQRQLREDFSFDNLQRRRRIAKDGPLEQAEVDALEEQAKAIERIQTKVEETQSAVDQASEDTSVAAAIDKDTKDITKQKRGPRKKDAFESALDRAIKALEFKGETNLDIFLVKTLGKPLLKSALQVVRAAYKGGKALAEAVADGIEHLRKGSKNLDEKKAQDFFDSIFAGAKPEKTVVGVNARAKANALVGEELSPSVVTDLVRAHIDAGVHGEKAVMKAVHSDLVKIHPELTERDVRRMYVDYGKVRFPSKEATAKEMRELTQLVKMQEDIDRMTQENLDPLRKGYQRDKATQAIRDKIKARNELLKKREGPPSPEKLATRDQAKQTALKNAIEDLDRELATGVKRERSKGSQDSPETERLRAERDAMREKLKEIADAEKPVKSDEERYNETTAKRLRTQLAAVKKRIADGDFAPRAKKIQPALDRKNLDAKALLEKARNEVRQGEERYRLANRTATQKAKDRAALLLQSARGIILGSDIGVLTRQGLFGWARPVKSIKATAEAFKAAVSPASMARWEIEVRDAVINGEPAGPKRRAADLSMTDTLNNSEELVITRLLSRIPDFNIGGKKIKLSVFGKSLERFQTTYINAMRASVFDSGIKAGLPPDQLKDLAHFINNATGRGNFKYVPKWMSIIFTSPRYEGSRWGILGEPMRNIGALARSGAKGELNRAALSNLKDMAVTVGLIYGLFKLAEMAAYSINWDPTSADFLKMRKGDEVWDVSAGLAPRIRDVMRLYVAFTHPDFKNNIGKSLLGPVIRAINPALKTPIDQAGVAIQRAQGNTEPNLPFSGFRSEEEREGWITMAPLIVQSVDRTLEEEGAGAAIFAGAREFVGSSVSRYPEPKASR